MLLFYYCPKVENIFLFFFLLLLYTFPMIIKPVYCKKKNNNNIYNSVVIITSKTDVYLLSFPLHNKVVSVVQCLSSDLQNAYKHDTSNVKYDTDYDIPVCGDGGLIMSFIIIIIISYTYNMIIILRYEPSTCRCERPNSKPRRPHVITYTRWYTHVVSIHCTRTPRKHVM